MIDDPVTLGQLGLGTGQMGVTLLVFWRLGRIEGKLGVNGHEDRP